MQTRDQIFRERLVDLVARVGATVGDDLRMRQRLGAMATQLAKEAGARDWADLKARADGATYDSLLNLFQRESEGATRSGDTLVGRAVEVLAVSLIARRQYQADLNQGVYILDKYIEGSERMARRARAQFIPVGRGAH